MIYQEKLDYYKTYHEYLALIKEINSIRHKYGLVTQVELNKDDVNLLNNNKFIAENENLYKTTLNFIKKNPTNIVTEYNGMVHGSQSHISANNTIQLIV